MRLTEHTDYALRVLMYLGANGGRLATTGEVAALHGISHHHLTKIVNELGHAGFVETVRGRCGGIRLARAPADIRVGDVIRRLEGRLSVKDTAQVGDRSPGEVAVHLLNEKLTEATDAALDDLTLEQLLEHVSRSGSLQQMYYI
jgi:Rrf2 family nitric oxide-sensitive transcriptional repressor